MKKLKTLVMMQLKEKINLSFLKSKKTFINKVIFTILKLFLVIALCYLMLFLCKFLNLFSFLNLIPTSVISIVFAVMLVLSTISCTFGLMKTLYSSHDNKILLTLPTKPIYVYFSKLIVFYLYELIKNFSFMIPMFVAFGLVNGLSFAFYPWLLFCMIFISMIPVLVGALLSIPTMYIVYVFKQTKMLQIIVFGTFVVLVTIGVIKAIGLIPQNIDLIATWGTTFWKIQDFLKAYTINFSIFFKLTQLLVGVRSGITNLIFTSSNFLTFGITIAFLITILGLTLLICKPLFYKMASKPFEYKKVEVKRKPKNKVSNKYISAIKSEFLLNIRSIDSIFNNLAILIGLPVAILLLNKIFGAMDTAALGNYLTLSFNILIILLLVLSSNHFAASIYSKDGSASYLLKVQPARYQPLLLSKLLFNGVITMLSIVACGVVIKLTTNLNTTNAVILTITILSLYVAHLFWSAEMDLMNPQYEIYDSIGNHANNPNETKSTIVAFLISFFMFGAALFFLMENINQAWYRLLIISMIFMVMRTYLLLTKIRLYYKEK